MCLLYAFPLLFLGDHPGLGWGAGPVSRLGLRDCLGTRRAVMLYLAQVRSLASSSGVQYLGREPGKGAAKPLKAVVMAGGRDRLRPMTANQPKPMLPVANRPIMEHVLRLLKRHGFDETIVTVQFLAALVRNYF